MKLSEYAADLMAMVELYGDHEVVEEDSRPGSRRIQRTVRAPRLRRVAVVKAGSSSWTWSQLAANDGEFAVPMERSGVVAAQLHAELTQELVYVI